MPCLNPTNIFIPNLKVAGVVSNKLFGKGSEFEKQRYAFELPVPMQSLLITVNG